MCGADPWQVWLQVRQVGPVDAQQDVGHGGPRLSGKLVIHTEPHAVTHDAARERVAVRVQPARRQRDDRVAGPDPLSA
jgi:hypothetical protein